MSIYMYYVGSIYTINFLEKRGQIKKSTLCTSSKRTLVDLEVSQLGTDLDDDVGFALLQGQFDVLADAVEVCRVL